jgi:hypothetical protein
MQNTDSGIGKGLPVGHEKLALRSATSQWMSHPFEGARQRRDLRLLLGRRGDRRHATDAIFDGAGDEG